MELELTQEEAREGREHGYLVEGIWRTSQYASDSDVSDKGWYVRKCDDVVRFLHHANVEDLNATEIEYGGDDPCGIWLPVPDDEVINYLWDRPFRPIWGDSTEKTH